MIEALGEILAVVITILTLATPVLAPFWWVPLLWLLIVLARRLLMWMRHHVWARDAMLVEVLPPPSAELAGAEAFWTQMLGLLRPAWKRLLFGQPHLVWEYAITQDGLQIRVWVPGGVPPRLVERAVEAAWPGASATTTAATPLARGASHGGMLRLARPDHYPLATSHEDDPLRGLLGAAGSPTPGETVLVQVAARPVTGLRLRKANQAAAQLRDAHSVQSRMFDALTPGRTPRGAGWAALRPEVSGEIRAILTKSVRPRLETVVRYLVTTPTDHPQGRQHRRGRAHAITGAFSAFSLYNHYKRRHTPFVAGWLSRLRFLGRGDLLSARELAAVAHLPLDEAVAGLERAPAKPIPPPPGLVGDVPEARVLGRSDAGPPRLIGQRAADARQHTHIIGGTGVGKTSLLLNMALDDIRKRRSVVFIEPKGESTLLLSRMPEEAIDRVVLIDPDDNAPPPALNPLSARDQGRSADTVTGIFKRIFADSWGPRTEDILRSACLSLAGTENAGPANIPRLLENSAFRKRVTQTISDPVLKGFWEWFDAQSGPARAHATAPLMNKLRSVLLRGFARDLLATTTQGLDLRTHLDTGGIVIARLPKGVLGEDTSSLLGSLLLSQVWNAVLSRARQREADRQDLAIYLDEAQNFLTLPYGVDDMLAEARAYRAGLTLAHQDLSQLPRDLREAVSANARSKIFFDVSPEDARQLARHMRPNLGEHDLSHLAAFQASARLVLHGDLPPPSPCAPAPCPHRSRAGRPKCARPPASTAHPTPERPPTRRRTPVAYAPHPPRPPSPYPTAHLPRGAAHPHPPTHPRNREIMRLVWEHRTLTTHQLTRLMFSSYSTAKERLSVLYRIRALDRFRPYTGEGSAPWHYVLDAPGAQILATETGQSLTEFGYRRDRALALAYQASLDHTVGVNDFFTELASHTRHHDTHLRWWTAAQCQAQWGDVVRPDAAGQWSEADRQVRFYLEHDTGTETLRRLADKIDAYTELRRVTSYRGVVLFWLPSERREHNVRARIPQPAVPAATAVQGAHPADTIWAQLDDPSAKRYRLSKITADVVQPPLPVWEEYEGG